MGVTGVNYTEVQISHEGERGPTDSDFDKKNKIKSSISSILVDSFLLKPGWFFFKLKPAWFFLG